jgi:hypothetical protein
VVFAIAGCTSAQSIEKAPPPFSKTTVGEPCPVQLRCNRRPPMSTSRSGGEPDVASLRLGTRRREQQQQSSQPRARRMTLWHAARV